MEYQIIRFILFIVLMAIYMFGFIKLAEYIDIYMIWRKRLLNIYATKIGFIMIIINTLVISISLLILTGNSYFEPLFLVAAVTIIISIIVELIWYLTSSSDVPWFARIIIARVETSYFPASSFSRILQIASNLGSILLLLLFIILVGVSFFGEDCCGEEWSKNILQITILYFVLAPQLFILPVITIIMMSKNIMAVTRMRLFINMFTNTISFIMFLSLLIWTRSGTSESPNNIVEKASLETLEVFLPNMAEYFSFSPLIYYFTVIYLLVIVIAPYLIGNKESKKFVRSLEKVRTDILNSLLKAFTMPNASYTTEVLENKANEIREDLDRIDEIPIVKFLDGVELDPPDSSVIKLALSDSKKRDPRFIHRDNLEEIHEFINIYKPELDEKINNRAAEYEVRDVQKLGIKLWETLKSEQGITDTTTKPWVMIILTTLVGSVISVLISSVAKIAVESMGINVG